VVFLKKIDRKALTPELAAQIYDLNLGTLGNLRSKRQGPKFYRQGRRIFYKVDELEAWLFKEPVMTVDAHGGEK
jgi:hypothetical protein